MDEGVKYRCYQSCFVGMTANVDVKCIIMIKEQVQ